MKTDYKFWYISRRDNVHISECAVRFYEGDMEEVEEEDEFGKIQAVARYVRSSGIDPNSMDHTKIQRIVKDTRGTEYVVYTDKDFGVITDDEELRDFVNAEMRKDTTRDNIPDQA